MHNLARAWRPKQFGEIVGQQLIVRILKNSLYKAHYFPAYLFSGQRGCGKTSTARVFAAALNCSELASFQKNPKENPLPCLRCASCIAMQTGAHPDFYEIDAASNTGVEHIRALIDSSALCPVIGGKKIYLIDEVHMLSKSAFNAFLKLLEEPPPSVFFILATTDQHKVPETVQSRCFILQFRPIEHVQTVEHLAHLCQQEDLRYQDDGLALIARACEGSMRDAVNILERVRFAASEITAQAVRTVLGHTDDQVIVQLLEAVIKGDGERVLMHLQAAARNGASADHVWERLKSCVRAVWWVLHGMQLHDFTAFAMQLKALARASNRSRLTQLTELLCLHELAFRRSSERYLLLELVLLQMCSAAVQKNPIDGGSGAVQAHDYQEAFETAEQEDADEPIDEAIAVLRSIDDPLVHSVMMQVVQASYDKKSNVVNFVFPVNRSFFSDLLDQTVGIWKPILQKAFGNEVRVAWQFTGAAVQDGVRRVSAEARTAVRTTNAQEEVSRKQSDTSDKNSASGNAASGYGRAFVKKSSKSFGGRSSSSAYTLELAYALHGQVLKKVSKQESKNIPQIAALLATVSGTVYEIQEVST